jgi:hypothetical protein
MSPAILAALALIGAAACKEAATSPEISADAELRFGATSKDPKRLAIDTGAKGSFIDTFAQHDDFFRAPVKFVLNKGGEEIELQFEPIKQPNETPHEVKRRKCSIKSTDGHVTGKGTLEVAVPAVGLLVIDCQRVIRNSTIDEPFDFGFTKVTLYANYPLITGPIEGAVPHLTLGCPPETAYLPSCKDL